MIRASARRAASRSCRSMPKSAASSKVASLADACPRAAWTLLKRCEQSVAPAQIEILNTPPETEHVSEPAASGARSHVLEGDVLDPEDRAQLPPLASMDVGAVINKALKA